MPYFGQDLFIKAQGKGPLDQKDYLHAVAKCQNLMRAQGIDAVMDQFKLDALIAPTGGPACLIDHTTATTTWAIRPPLRPWRATPTSPFPWAWSGACRWDYRSSAGPGANLH